MDEVKNINRTLSHISVSHKLITFLRILLGIINRILTKNISYYVNIINNNTVL